MYVKVRPVKGGPEIVLNLSKLTKVEDLRLMIEERCAVTPDTQRLFFQGKQVSYPCWPLII